MLVVAGIMVVDEPLLFLPNVKTKPNIIAKMIIRMTTTIIIVIFVFFHHILRFIFFDETLNCIAFSKNKTLNNRISIFNNILIYSIF